MFANEKGIRRVVSPLSKGINYRADLQRCGGTALYCIVQCTVVLCTCARRVDSQASPTIEFSHESMFLHDID